MRRVLAWTAACGAVFFPVADAAAICRQVTVTSSAPAPIDPDQDVLVALRKDWPIGQDCSGPVDGDAGIGGDAGAADAGVDAGVPDAASPDASAANSGDAGELDAGPGDAGAADAGPDSCTTVYGDAVTMVVQPRFETGNLGAEFALLMVTPRVPVIELAPNDTFERLRSSTEPEVVTREVYIEDTSLGYQCRDPKWRTNDDGCGGDWGSDYGGNPRPPSGVWPVDAGTPDGEPEIQTLGPYEVVVLDVDDTASLATWLGNNDFRYTQADLEAIGPYVELAWTVVAVRVSVDGSAFSGALDPISLTWAGAEARLPLGLSRGPSGTYTLSVYVAADARYDVPGSHVSYAQPRSTAWGRYLTRSDLIVERNRTIDEDPVIERSTGGDRRDQVEEVIEVRIPSSQCPDSDDDSLCGCRTPSDGGPYHAGRALLLLAVVLLLRRARRA